MEKIYQAYLQSSGVFTDTRQILKGGMFFALKGAHFNGNTYAAAALEAGASYAVIDEPEYLVTGKTFLVTDALEALQKLAHYHRKQLQIPIVAITGSNGKTTTKELIHAILSTQFKVLATQGNLNNHIGVPLTLLKLKPDHQIGIIEMGANHQKEIAELAAIAQPNYGLITNYGLAHLEGFGGFDGVIKGKTELFDFLSKNETALVNADDPIQMEKTAYQKRKTYGTTGDYAIKKTMQDGFAAIEISGDLMVSQLSGAYNANNLCAAAAVGLLFDVPPHQIKMAIAKYTPNMNRSEWRQTEHNTLLMDAYNANPSSMQAAINSFGNQEPNRWAILGDMFELGPEAHLQHRKIIALAQEKLNNQVIFVGANFYQNKNIGGIFLKDTQQLLAHLQGNPLRNCTVLLKGSRGMALEKAVPLL